MKWVKTPTGPREREKKWRGKYADIHSKSIITRKKTHRYYVYTYIYVFAMCISRETRSQSAKIHHSSTTHITTSLVSIYFCVWEISKCTHFVVMWDYSPFRLVLVFRLRICLAYWATAIFAQCANLISFFNRYFMHFKCILFKYFPHSNAIACKHFESLFRQKICNNLRFIIWILIYHWSFWQFFGNSHRFSCLWIELNWFFKQKFPDFAVLRKFSWFENEP